MYDLNQVNLIGRLGSNPIRRATKNGHSVTNFSLATSKKVRVTSETGRETFREETEWHRIVTWGKLADRCAEYLRKGAPVHLEGSIRSRKYLGNDGKERFVFEIVAGDVRFLPGMRKDAFGELVSEPAQPESGAGEAEASAAATAEPVAPAEAYSETEMMEAAS